MDIILKRGKRGGVLVVVKFKGEKNFDPVRLEWVPRLRELEEIGNTLRMALAGEKGNVAKRR